MPTILRVFLLLFLLINTIKASTPKYFTVSYDPDFAPFSYLEKKEPEGLLIDYWKLWAKKNNYKIKFINGKFWDNAINLAKKGEVDFFLGTAPYELWMKSSFTVYRTKTSLFINKDLHRDFNFKTPYLIGIVGNDHKKLISEKFPFSQILVYKDYKLLFKDLLSKKLDLIFDDKVAIEFYALRNNFFHKINPLEPMQDYTSIKVISKNKDLIEIFNEGFKKLTSEDLYDIENSWILDKNQQIYKKSFSLTPKEKDFIQNNVFKVSVSNDWRPVTFKNEKGELDGMASEIWEVIKSKLNLKCEYNFSDSFTQQLNSIKDKSNDIIFSSGETKDRIKYSLFSKPYIEFPFSIVTLKDENFIENIDYLFNKKIAVVKNFTAQKLLKENFPQIELIIVKDVKEGLKKVSRGEAFAYVDIKPNLIYYINKLKFNNLKISGNTGLDYKIEIMIRDDYPQLQTIFNKVISSLDEKEISRILNKWNNVQFEENFDYTNFWIAISIIFIIFLILIYKNQLNVKRNISLKQLVNERTKELRELNEELEKRVDRKTKELIKANYLLDEAQKIARLGSFSYNTKTKTLQWSDEHFKIFGLYPNEINPSLTAFLSFVHEDDRKRVKIHLYKATKSDKRKAVELRIELRDNSIKYIQLTTKVTKFDSNNKPIVVIGTVFDLTKIKELELQKREKDSMLAQQSKMAALGEMLENIAHQWRQPLSVISTASTGLQIQLEMNNEISKEFLYKSVKSINEHSQYLSKTIDDFRNFFNPRKEKALFTIDSTIEKALSLVSTRVKKYNIEIVKDLKDIKIETIESELIQILLNILNNAIDALNSKNQEKKYIFISTISKNNLLHIKIKDNAGGIPAKIINRVFEPYFTTKHKSQGTGIGLYMSNEIVTKHLNGVLKVSNSSFTYNNDRYSGALFTISIPTQKAKV
ncbi:transporter substrate-binding domain-containing protein [Halarcobacter anaerophilus]|uniref:transporter substrate-binding domain-containing protein n=1 Tax=Halarcobacter anaerophilus TaxID=877500 RepID=UPI000698F874|nr:transporter substrate-binding domain-containing protein [Halarcobacter anaerophilus]